MKSLLRRLCVAAGVLSLIAGGIPVAAADTRPAKKVRQEENNGQVSGTAKDRKGAILPLFRVRVRNVTTGKVARESKTDEKGNFVFTGLNPGTYVVEVVGAKGAVIATSASFSLTLGSMTLTGVTVTAATALGAGIGAAGAAAGSSFFTSNAGVILLTAAAGAITGIIITKTTASPSR